VIDPHRAASRQPPASSDPVPLRVTPKARRRPHTADHTPAEAPGRSATHGIVYGVTLTSSAGGRSFDAPRPDERNDVPVQPAALASDLLTWPGTARYEVVRCIGRGGMGVVYEAHDRERDRRVAVKTLLRFSPGALYQFKQEFRTLANVLHRNLVQLYITETQ
jgi:hypothetical protein